jgi:hypothetical protein
MPAPRNRPPSAYARKTTTLPASLRDELVALGRLDPLPQDGRRKRKAKPGGQRRSSGSGRDTEAKENKGKGQQKQEPAAARPAKPAAKAPTTALQKLVDKTGGEGSSSSRRKKKEGAPREAPRDEVEEQEEAEIAWLEAQLGIASGKKKKEWRQEFEADGLGGVCYLSQLLLYLFEWLC